MQNPETPNRDHAANPPADQPEPRRGRPPLDASVLQRIIELVARGCSRRLAARCVGCCPATITRAAARDPQFASELAQAETHVEVEMIGAIRRAARNDRYWRAAGWLLERRFPNDYNTRPPNTYTPDQVAQLFVAALESIQPQLPPACLEQLIQKLGDLLLAFDPQKNQSTPPNPSAST